MHILDYFKVNIVPEAVIDKAHEIKGMMVGQGEEDLPYFFFLDNKFDFGKGAYNSFSGNPGDWLIVFHKPGETGLVFAVLLQFLVDAEGLFTGPDDQMFAGAGNGRAHLERCGIQKYPPCR